jgi:hypothetical protein
MSYFAAYLLWHLLPALLALFTALLIISGLGLVPVIICKIITNTGSVLDKEKIPHYLTIQKYFLKILLPIFIVSVLFLIIVPPSDIIVKIVATKQGVDILTAKETIAVGEKSYSILMNSLDLVNKKVLEELKPENKGGKR